MKSLYLIPALPLICCYSATAQDTHASLANEIIDFLSQTEICLNLCRDAQSVQDTLPQIKELSAYAAELKARQAKLADFTPAEDKEIAKLLPTYMTLQKAINAHVERLISEQLLTPELAEILCISPDYASAPPPTTN